MTRRWEGDGPGFGLEWSGRRWGLRVDEAVPGLRVDGEAAGPLLALEGLAVPGRGAGVVFSAASLLGFERRFERVEAQYAPSGWGDLTVRAAWSPVGADGMDMEVQVSAVSVGELKSLEVIVASVLPEAGPSGRRRRWVEPRDRRAAALSYDGRETSVSDLTTLPTADGAGLLAPRVIPGPWPGDWSYIEMVHPHDVARRITESGRPARVGHATRYGLFGHDLEKGVVLRARLRGVWTRSATAREDALRLYDDFVAEPPPLGP